MCKSFFSMKALMAVAVLDCSSRAVIFWIQQMK